MKSIFSISEKFVAWFSSAVGTVHLLFCVLRYCWCCYFLMAQSFNGLLQLQVAVSTWLCCITVNFHFPYLCHSLPLVNWCNFRPNGSHLLLGRCDSSPAVKKMTQWPLSVQQDEIKKPFIVTQWPNSFVTMCCGFPPSPKTLILVQLFCLYYTLRKDARNSQHTSPVSVGSSVHYFCMWCRFKIQWIFREPWCFAYEQYANWAKLWSLDILFHLKVYLNGIRK